MNRFNWVYVDDYGKRHNVGIYHGPRTGHLMIYCNSKIILIDFLVFADKSYSFFINDEFCEIEVERIDNRFYYGFNINKEVDTPKNRIRRNEERRNLGFSLLLLLGMFLFVGIILISINSHRYFPPSDPLHTHTTKKTTAILSKVTGDPFSPSAITYSYVANSAIITSAFDQMDSLPLILPGMPLHVGDQFELLFAEKYPKASKLLLNRPTPRQVQQFMQRAAMAHKRANPNFSDQKIVCEIQAGFELANVQGLALFFPDPPVHLLPFSYASLQNSASFQEFTRSCAER